MNKSNNTKFKIKKPIDKKKIAGYVLAVLMFFWTLGSVCGVIALFRDDKPTITTASADTIQEIARFESENIYFPSTSTTLANPTIWRPDYTNSVNVTLTITSYNDGTYMLVPTVYSTKQTLLLEFVTLDLANNTRGSTRFSSIPISPLNVPIGNNKGRQYYGGVFPSSSNFTGCYCIMVPAVEEGFDVTGINQITLGNKTGRYSTAHDYSVAGLEIYNYIQFTDVNNLSFRVSFVAMTTSTSSGLGSWADILRVDNRSYYTSLQLGENQVFKAGYSAGYETAKNQYTNSGYQDGYRVGYREGELAGYNEGIADSNEYSFFNLFGSLIDVPLNAISSLFNFDIFGINVMDFVSSLFTICVALLVLKLIF